MEPQPRLDVEPFSWPRAPVLLADRLGVRPAGLIGGIVAVLAAAVGGWWALRPPPPPVEDSLPRVVDLAAAVTPTSSTSPVLVVHVGGGVERPGVHEVMPGARVVDAVQAAGGLRSDADHRRFNLARPVSDGERVWIPVEGEALPPALGPVEVGGEDTASMAAPLSLSTASAALLETLPGVGPSLAAAIIEHRNRAGPFRRVDDLLEVRGIGPTKLAAIRDLVQP